MSITIEAWEDSGPAVSGRGTTQQKVINVGHKDDDASEDFNWGYYPIVRPSPGSANESDNMALSFHKYTFFKISGTYSSASKVRVKIVGNLTGAAGTGIADKVRLVYKWTNTYATPSNDMLIGSTYDEADLELLPFLSETGPDTATSFCNILQPNTTYYTNYLVTQLHVDPSILDDHGNIPLITFECHLVDYETDVTNDYDFLGC